MGKTTDESHRMLSDTVTEAHVAEVVARATGIPVGSLLEGEVRCLGLLTEPTPTGS